MEKGKMALFEFAFFSCFDVSISFLAKHLAAPEPWDFGLHTPKHYPILKNYLEQTFRKVLSEGKILYKDDNSFCTFNTGLVTPNLEPIYALFDKNTVSIHTPYHFKAFLKRSDEELLNIFNGELPDRANYFEHPEDLIFNPNCELIAQVDHIIGDEKNKNRLPESFRKLPNDEMIRRLDGAIEECKKRVRANYTLAVPQFYNERIQLLLPLNLTSRTSNPDLALVVSRVSDGANVYTARTCLTLRMAYNNARLIIKPQSSWLHP